MDAAAILQGFLAPPPRRIYRKRDGPDVGVGFNPWEVLGILGPCLGIALIPLAAGYLLPLPPSLSGTLRLFGAFLSVALAILCALASFGCLMYEWRHRTLARHGTAALGTVTRYAYRQLPDHGGSDTIEYTFATRDGRVIHGKRESASGYYKSLKEGEPVVVVYLPGRPKQHEPYNSLMYQLEPPATR